MATFAERLKSLRDQKGLTQEGLASALGVSRSTIGGYEAPSKEREPDFAIVCRLASFFGVSTDYLLGRSDDPTPVAPPGDLTTIARRLEAIRKSRGWSQRELADRLGITVPELARYESAIAAPPDELVDKLADAFEVDRRYFTGEIDQAEIEKLLGETWFRAPAKLSPEAKKSVEDFIAFVIAQEERKKQQET